MTISCLGCVTAKTAQPFKNKNASADNCAICFLFIDGVFFFYKRSCLHRVKRCSVSATLGPFFLSWSSLFTTAEDICALTSSKLRRLGGAFISAGELENDVDTKNVEK